MAARCEMQRVAIVRALINYPGIIMADEPAAHLNKSAVMPVISCMGPSRAVAWPGNSPLAATTGCRVLFLYILFTITSPFVSGFHP
jgi:hypothetical protein